MCFAGSVQNAVAIVNGDGDEEMSEADCRKRAGDKDVSTESVVQVKKSPWLDFTNSVPRVNSKKLDHLL